MVSDAKSRAKADARNVILSTYDSYSEQARLIGAQPSITLFLQRYNANALPDAQAARKVFPVMHVSTLSRWLRLRATSGMKELEGNYGNRLGAGILDTDAEMGRDIINAIRKALSASKIRAELIARYGPSRPPGIRTIQRFITQHKATSKPV